MTSPLQGGQSVEAFTPETLPGRAWFKEAIADVAEGFAEPDEVALKVARLHATVEDLLNQNERVRRALVDAAAEIPAVAGPVAHRIRVLRKELSAEIGRLSVIAKRIDFERDARESMAVDRDVAEKQLEECEQSFDLYYCAIIRGQKMWRDEKPAERELIGPDTGNLVKWLLDLVTRAETVARSAT